jgi:hypothetical protein
MPLQWLARSLHGKGRASPFKPSVGEISQIEFCAWDELGIIRTNGSSKSEAERLLWFEMVN